MKTAAKKRKGIIVAACVKDTRLKRKNDEAREGLDAWVKFGDMYNLHFYSDIYSAALGLPKDKEELGPFEFMVTNVPFDKDMHNDFMLPKSLFYDKVYGRSFASLDRIHATAPEIRIITYTGADGIVCVKAVEEHHAYRAVRKGRDPIKDEIDEVIKAIEE